MSGKDREQKFKKEKVANDNHYNTGSILRILNLSKDLLEEMHHLEDQHIRKYTDKIRSICKLIDKEDIPPNWRLDWERIQTYLDSQEMQLVDLSSHQDSLFEMFYDFQFAMKQFREKNEQIDA